jgi:hypothetical protein
MAKPLSRRDHQERAAAPAAAASPAFRDLGAELAALGELDLHGLRVRWRKLFRVPAPPSPLPFPAPAHSRLPPPGERPSSSARRN